MTWDQCQIISLSENYNWTNFGENFCRMITPNKVTFTFHIFATTSCTNLFIYGDYFLPYGQIKSAKKSSLGQFLRLKTNIPEMELFHSTDNSK